MLPNYARPITAHILRVIGAGLVLGAGFVGGCSVMPPIPSPVSSQQIAADKQATAARSRSLERVVSGINAETVRAWINRKTAPQNAAPTPIGPRAIYISVDALARRHTAWQLADELSSAPIAPTEPRALQIKVPALEAPRANGKSQLDIPAVAALPERPSRSLSATVSQSPAILASRATLDDFLSDLRARQNDLESAESELARRALEDRIRASTRGAVEAISLEPVSPEIALELSNLRLQLLTQLRVPATQREAAKAKIEAIEKRLNDIWQAQTDAQNARLREAFEELPARLRREGLAALDAAAAKRDSERYFARLELRSIVENRLGSAQPNASDTQILRLLLPSARVATPNLSASGNSSFQTSARNRASAVVQTNDGLFDARDKRPLGKSDDLGGQSVAQLREQARRDARQWASKLALSWGAQLSNQNGAPDRTELAIQKLFGTSNS